MVPDKAKLLASQNSVPLSYLFSSTFSEFVCDMDIKSDPNIG